MNRHRYRRRVFAVLRAVLRFLTTGFMWTGFATGFVPMELPSPHCADRGGGKPDGAGPATADGARPGSAAEHTLPAQTGRRAAADADALEPQQRRTVQRALLSPAEEKVWTELVKHLS
jgi:hypothetical protein